jgi:DNA-binding NarL/FixJ family response regulator
LPQVVIVFDSLLCMERKRIVVFDLDIKFSELVESIVGMDRNFKLINLYKSKEEVLKNLTFDQPDVLIADLDYGGIDDIQFIQELKRRIMRIDLLILTECLDPEFLLQAIGKGVTGILRKDSCFPKLIDALTTISNGGSPVDPYVSRLILNSLQENLDPLLTDQENRILQLLSRGLTTKSIAAELSISQHTSRTHVKNIYKKLSVNSKTEALKKARFERIVPART